MLFLFMVGTTGYVEGNLDSAAGMAIAELFQTINKSGETIILVTHNREIAKYAGRTIVMRDGQIMGTL
jgi:putative ABC transport system ATP-binding protein